MKHLAIYTPAGSPALSAMKLLRIVAASQSILAFQSFAQSVIGLGFLPGGSYSVGLSASSDGSVVAGVSGSSAGQRVVRWTRCDGLYDLGTFPGGTISAGAVSCISGDGSIVVGASTSPNGQSAFRWTKEEGMIDLGVFPGGTVSSCNGISGDGSVIVGISGSSWGPRAFRWTQQGGLEGLEPLPGDTGTSAYVTNYDGSVVAGVEDGMWAFRWSLAGGRIRLGALPGGSFSTPYAISGDGSVIAGFSNAGDLHTQAFRWAEAGGMENLGAVPGDHDSFGFAMNTDGTVVVGQSGIGNASRASIWTRASGMIDLSAYLASLGINSNGWQFTSALGISSDGLTITGDGFHGGLREGWVAVLPNPCFTVSGVQAALDCFTKSATLNVMATGEGPLGFEWRRNGVSIDAATNPTAATSMLRLATISAADSGCYDCVVTAACGRSIAIPAWLSVCLGDFNCDGGVDGTDMNAFYGAWEAGEVSADVNADGGVDGADVQAFFIQWENGC